MAGTEQTSFFRRSAALPYVEMRRTWRTRACYHIHTHDEFSFGVIDEGRAGYRNGRRRLSIGRGDIVLVNPGEPHACNPQADAWSYRMLFVDTRWVGELQEEIAGHSGIDYLPFTSPLVRDERPAQAAAFDRLFAVLQRDNPLAAEEALIDFLSRRFFTAGQLICTDRQPQPAAQLAQAKAQILDCLGDNLSIQTLARQAGLSRYHLIRCFKQHYGQTPHAYQLDQRIIKAKALLRQGKAIAETALTLGFADQSHFQRHFKKRMAATPGQYQACFVETKHHP